jgi:hypothetical protein
MSLLSICQWVQSTGFFTDLRSSWYVYPVVMSLHMTGIALFGGMVLAVDLRLLGVAMRKRPVQTWSASYAHCSGPAFYLWLPAAF